MKKLFLFVLLLPFISAAQPVITNAENFTTGITLRFIECQTNGVQPGASGANVTWDFSNLVANGDTMTEWMVAPSATSYASQFPTANLVEKYSDGTFVFANISGNQNHLVGYVDSIGNFVTKYPNPVLFMQRPITYNDVFTDAFTAQITGTSFSLNGSGNTNIEADGYGTLILPNGTFNNVLRVHYSMVEVDTLVGFGSYTTTHAETYVWFDNAHTSALFKIDSSSTSGAFNEKNVEYLLDETISSVVNIDNALPTLNAFFSGNDFTIVSTFQQNDDCEVKLFNALGQRFECETKQLGSQLIAKPSHDLPSGFYNALVERNGEIIGVAKALKTK